MTSKLADVARRSAASFFRHTPQVRGRGRVAGIINDLLLPNSAPAVFCTQMRLGYEMRVDLRSATEFPAFYTGDYDTRDIQSAMRLLTAESVVFDVGANVGFWTIPLARAVQSSGAVHSFEPVMSNFARLSENIAINGLQSAANLYPFGLSDRSTRLRVSLGDDFARGSQTGNASIVIDAEDLQHALTDVDVCSLDGLIDSINLNRLDFIKVDIEGHEDKFLSGATQTIRRYRPSLYMEINVPYYERRGLDAMDIFETWLKEFEYRAVLNIGSRWRFDQIRSCRLPRDDAFFFPAETADLLVEKLAS